MILRSARQRTLLAVLLVARPSVVSTDRLSETVWGSRQPRDPGQTLYTQISRLRRRLARAGGHEVGDLIVTRAPGYALMVEADQVDAGRFERLAARAGAAGTPREVVDLAGRAMALWRGPPLGEFDQVFARTEASRLEELRLGLIIRRADALLALGRAGEVLAEFEPVISDNPLHEQLHGRLMLALYRCGRQADALAVYRNLRDRLATELGLEPSIELRHLERDILQQRLELAGQMAVRRPAVEHATRADSVSGDATAGMLPAEVTSFVGRHGEVADVGSALDGARLVTLTGVGGVGKTRLALRVAREATPRFADGVRLCDLAAVKDRRGCQARSRPPSGSSRGAPAASRTPWSRSCVVSRRCWCWTTASTSSRRSARSSTGSCVRALGSTSWPRAGSRSDFPASRCGRSCLSR